MRRAAAGLFLASVAFVGLACSGGGAEEAATSSATEQTSTDVKVPTEPATQAIAGIRGALDALDREAGAFDFRAADALPRAERIAGEYADLAARARAERSRGLSRAEDELWDAFVAYLDYRVEMADMVVDGVRAGDLTALSATLDAAMDEAVAVEERFNRALKRYFPLEADGT